MATNKTQYSIHPRNWPNGNRQKSNTAKPWNGRGILEKKTRRLENRRQARDMAVGKNEGLAMAWKRPGSMNK